MRTFIAVLILIFSFQSWTKADDIRDFQIEGISIGSSLLEYYEEEEIKKEVKKSLERKHQYKNNFIDVNFRPKGDEGYENIMITIKSNDNNYTIYVVAGITFFKNDIKNCYSKTNEISKEIKNMFSKKIKSKKINRKHWADKTGKSKYKGIEFKFKGGDIDLMCYDWSKNMSKKYNYWDQLMISIKSKEFQNTAF
tara:strand:- start:243 stop:827 length:585 start_codon:yes stop_codon:yes gene_type:complete